MKTTGRYLFLDDDDTRHGSFRQQTIGTVVDHARSAAEAETLLLLAPEPYDTVFLDGDLDPHAAAGMKPLDQTGEDVCVFIVDGVERALWPRRVVIHSLNAPRARAMAEILEPLRAAGVEVLRAPFHRGLAAEVGR